MGVHIPAFVKACGRLSLFLHGVLLPDTSAPAPTGIQLARDEADTLPLGEHSLDPGPLSLEVARKSTVVPIFDKIKTVLTIPLSY